SGVSLSKYPLMDQYIHYVLLSDQIDAEKLFAEIKQLEEAAYASLIKTPEEKKLVAESKQLYLTGKLLDFALTREEWTEYRSSSRDLLAFETFYREAEIRDGLMA